MRELSTLLVIFIVFSHAVAIPIGRLDTEVANLFLRELYMRGRISAGRALLLPTEIGDGDRTIDSAATDKALWRPIILNSRRFAAADQSLRIGLVSVGHGHFGKDFNKAYWQFFPGLSYGISGNIGVHVEYRIDSQLTGNPDYSGKKWNGWAGYAETATAGYVTNRISVELGRRRTGWPMGRRAGSLFISPSAMPLDGLFIRYRFNDHAELASITAFLSPITDPAGSPSPENRYLSAHALVVSPFSWLDIMLKESVIYGGQGRRPELYYVFPLLWYHAEQLNKNRDDNTFIGLGAVFRRTDRAAAYFDFLIDDLQIENRTASDREPSEYGFSGGICLFDFPVKTTNLELTYDHIRNRTYNQMCPYNRYENEGIPIGDSLGPDHDRFGLFYDWHISDFLFLTASVTFQRRGEGRLTDEWTAPWLDSQDYQEDFPSGIVEKTTKAHLALIAQKNHRWQSKLALEYVDIRNDKNIRGIDRRTWGLYYAIVYDLPQLSWRIDDE